MGQKEIVGKDKIISKLIATSKQSGYFPSLIFWGPPGSGKTTLARIIANELKREFFEFSAVNTSSKEIQKIISVSQGVTLSTQGDALLSPIVFIDEIHRFNKAQQDRLLPYVEDGRIILIGATTENPSFEVIGPLLSRSRVVVLSQLAERELKTISGRALRQLKKEIEPPASSFLLEASNGDARVLLNVLEIAGNLSQNKKLTIENIEEALQRRQLTFDKQGEEFYNTISSYLKSMRASQVDAALYYLARMVTAGQDPLYIARRMVVFASEDVASPTALVVANSVFQACQQIGYPECQENLAAGTVYLATAKKDRSAYEAYMRALEDVQKFGNLPIPLQIRNPVTKLMKDIGYGKGYEKYTKEDLLPDKLKGKNTIISKAWPNKYLVKEMRNRIKYSQNFLRDNRLVEDLIGKSGICSSDIVYEIGAGEGIITQELLKKAKRVIAFELDRNFFDKLTYKFRNEENLELKSKDFLVCKLPNQPYKVFSNIPFNITSAIIKKLTLEGNSPGDSYLIVQKEAAEKFVGKPLDNKNSQIAVILYPWFELRVIHNFRANDFFPRPNVDIVLLEIKKRSKPLVDTQYKDKYENFVTYTFNQFKPNIMEGLSRVLGKQNIIQVAREMGFSPTSKPSELSFANWLDLFSLFLKSPVNQQNLVRDSFAGQFKQQENLERIHRTRVDKNWRKYS